MQSLRNARSVTRLALGWFIAALLVAIASPVFQPQSLDVVCIEHGAIKLVAHGDSGDTTTAKTLHCPLCGALGAPPPMEWRGMPVTPSLSVALQGIPEARIAAATAAPLPARGPPSFS